MTSQSLAVVQNIRAVTGQLLGASAAMKTSGASGTAHVLLGRTDFLDLDQPIPAVHESARHGFPFR